MKTTASEASNTEIFVIVNEKLNGADESNVVLRVDDFCIEKTNLYRHVMKSAEETTAPVGVTRKLHIREKIQECAHCYNRGDDTYNEDCPHCYKGEQTVYEVCDWGFRGQNLKVLETLDSEEAAEDDIFNRVYKYDFERDDQRNTMFFDTLEEASDDLIEILSCHWSVDLEVAKHIFRKIKAIAPYKLEREERLREERIKMLEAEQLRVNKLAEVYANMIEPQSEGFKETAARLGSAIGDTIESKVFYKAVKMVRARYVK